MIGFAAATRAITAPLTGAPPALDLTLLSFEDITKGLPAPAANTFGPAKDAPPASAVGNAKPSDTAGRASSGRPAANAAQPPVFRRAEVSGAAAPPPAAPSVAGDD